MQIDTQTLLVIVGATAAVFTLANLMAAFQWWVVSRLDNSRLSAIARELGLAPAAPLIPPPPPSPPRGEGTPPLPPATPVALSHQVAATSIAQNPPPAPAPAAAQAAPAPQAPTKFTVTATVFGQPGDSESDVAYADVKAGWPNRPGVALPFRFTGARPNVQVWGPKGNCITQIVDVGPWNTHDPYWTTNTRPQAESGTDLTGRHANGAGIDLTPAAAAAVGIDGKGTVSWAFVDATATSFPTSNEGAKGVVGEPAWLTFARAEIGFHETGNNRGIGKYVALAGYGAEGEPWCSIFVGAMLKAAGIDIAGANAMAQSWTTAPCVTKIDSPRLGCLAAFWRGTKGSGEGHVGFYVGDASAEHINVLGGNENDQVMIEAMPTDSSSFGLLGYYWPKVVPASASTPPKVT